MAINNTVMDDVSQKLGGASTKLQLQAISPDLLNDMSRLEALFRSYHEERGEGAIAPELPVIRADGEDITEVDTVLSLAVSDGDRFVAHIAVRFDSNHCTELIYPAILNSYRKHSFDISRLIWDHIGQLAARQGWRTVYQFSPASESCLQIISTKCFDSFETALLPDNRLGGHSIHEGATVHPKNHALLLMFHCFDGSYVGGPLERPIYLYPPSSHLEKVRELLGGAELKRVIVEEEKGKRSELQLSPTDPNAVTIKFRPVSAALEISVLPKGLLNYNHALLQIEEAVADALVHQSRSYVRVALDDPMCPPFSRKLEESGFRFFGVFPVVDGRDWLLFSRFDSSLISDVNLYTPRARLLRDYMIDRTAACTS